MDGTGNLGQNIHWWDSRNNRNDSDSGRGNCCECDGKNDLGDGCEIRLGDVEEEEGWKRMGDMEEEEEGKEEEWSTLGLAWSEVWQRIPASSVHSTLD